jgi:hypothetical protein
MKREQVQLQGREQALALAPPQLQERAQLPLTN